MRVKTENHSEKKEEKSIKELNICINRKVFAEDAGKIASLIREIDPFRRRNLPNYGQSTEKIKIAFKSAKLSLTNVRRGSIILNY